MGFDDMVRLIKESRITLAHAGAGTFLLCMTLKKIPIVVPRLKDLGEHVSNHQLEFCNKLDTLQKAIVVFDEDETQVIAELWGNIMGFNPASIVPPNFLSDLKKKELKMRQTQK